MSNLTRIDALVAAYNAKEIDKVAEMLSPDLQFFHFNHGFVLDRGGLIDALKLFAEELMPDRVLSPATRQFAYDDLVVREGFFEGKPKADIPFGKAGSSVHIKVCTIFRLDQAGLVVEWTDYG